VRNSTIKKVHKLIQVRNSERILFIINCGWLGKTITQLCTVITVIIIIQLYLIIFNILFKKKENVN